MNPFLALLSLVAGFSFSWYLIIVKKVERRVAVEVEAPPPAPVQHDSPNEARHATGATQSAAANRPRRMAPPAEAQVVRVPPPAEAEAERTVALSAPIMEEPPSNWVPVEAISRPVAATPAPPPLPAPTPTPTPTPTPAPTPTPTPDAPGPSSPGGIDDVVYRPPMAARPEPQAPLPPIADALPDGRGPEGYTVKGDSRARLYLLGDDPDFARARADLWFRDEQAALDEGFSHYVRSPHP